MFKAENHMFICRLEEDELLQGGLHLDICTRF